MTDGIKGPGDLERVIRLLGSLPGLGPRSARRAALHLMKQRDTLLRPLADALASAADAVANCSECGNLDSSDPCSICRNPRRDSSRICVVRDVSDLWALERAGIYGGHYHVTGGLLSPLDGVGPEDLGIGNLVLRAGAPEVAEVILALDATVDGQTTAHYIGERLSECGVEISRLARGVPVGGQLDYLDDGTLAQALKGRGRL